MKSFIKLISHWLQVLDKFCKTHNFGHVRFFVNFLLATIPFKIFPIFISILLLTIGHSYCKLQNKTIISISDPLFDPLVDTIFSSPEGTSKSTTIGLFFKCYIFWR